MIEGVSNEQAVENTAQARPVKSASDGCAGHKPVCPDTEEVKELIYSIDPRLKFVDQVLDQIRAVLVRDQKWTGIHSLRLRFDLATGNDEVRIDRTKSFSRA